MSLFFTQVFFWAAFENAYAAQSNSTSGELTAATINGASGMQRIGSSSSAAKRTVAWTRTAYIGAVNVYWARESVNPGYCTATDPANQPNWDANILVTNSVLSSSAIAGATIAGLTDATDYCLLIRSASASEPWALTDQFEIDNTVPTITAKETQDLDGDGKIDAVKITFDDEVLDSTVVATDFDVAGYVGEAFSSTTNSDVANNNIIYITFTEGGAVDSDATPTLAYTATTPITDLADNVLANSGAAATSDKAAPVAISSTYKDMNADGQVDRVDVVFSEAILDDGYNAADYSATTAGTINLGAESGVTPAAAVLQIAITGDAGKTGGATNPAIGYTNNFVNASRGLNDAANNAVVSFSTTATDAATPIYLSSSTLDNDNNGTVDFVKVVYTESVLDSSVVAADFEAGIADTTNTNLVESFTGLTPAAGNETDVANDNTIYIGVANGTETLNANKTDYTLKIQQVGAVTDATPNSYASFASQTSTDGAKPRILSAAGSTGTDTDNDGKTDNYVVTFTENVTDRGAAAANANFTAKNSITSAAITITTMGIGATAGGGANKMTFNLDDTDADNYTGPILFTYDSGSGGATVVDASVGLNTFTNVTDNALIDDVEPVLLSSRGGSNGGTADVLNNAGEIIDFRFSEPMNAATPSFANLNAAITFAGGAVDANDNLGGGANTITRVTLSMANDTYRVTQVDTASTDLITPGTDTAQVTTGTNVLDVANNQANTNPAAVTISVADITAPTITARETQDLDGDGKIDAVKITFSESILDSTVTIGNFDIVGYAGEAFSSTTNSDVADNDVIYITFTEGGSSDSNATPVVTYTQGTLADPSTNLLLTSSVAAADLAKPVFTASRTAINTIVLTFSENVDVTTTAGEGYAVAGATVTVNTDPAGAANTITLTTTGLTATDGTPAVTYTVAAGTTVDGAANEVANAFAANAADAVKPTFTAARTGINTIVLTFSENVTAADTATAAWTLSSGTVASVTQPTASTSLTITTTGLTGTSETPTVDYVAASGTVADNATVPNEVANGGAVVSTDAVAPTFTAARTGINTIVLTFSENVDAGDTATAAWTLSSGTVAAVTDPGNTTTITMTTTGLTGTSETPTVDYVAASGTVADAATNEVANGGAVVAADAVAPTFTAARTALNTIVLTFSENVTAADTATAAWTLSAGTVASVTQPTASTTLTMTTTGLTGTSETPTVNYVAASGTVADNATAPNEVANGGAVVATDGVAPVATAISVTDANGNGTLDTATITFSEALANTAAAANGFDVTSAANHGTCNTESADPAGTTTLVLTFACTTQNTAIGDLTVGFTANANVADAATNQVASTSFTSASSPAITDAANPVALSAAITKAISSGNLSTNAVLEVTFSEAVTPTAVANANWKFSRNGVEASSAANWTDGATVAYAAGSSASNVKMTLSAPTTSGTWTSGGKVNLSGNGIATIQDAALNNANMGLSDISISGLIGPAVDAIAVTAQSTTTATIGWISGGNTTANAVNYGTSPALGSNSVAGAPGEGSTTHSINLTGLTAGVLYYYQVCSTNVSETCSAIHNFTTSATDTVAPSFVSSTPSNAATAVSVTAGTATLLYDESLTIADQTKILIRKASDSSSVKNGNATVATTTLSVLYNTLEYSTSYRITIQSGALSDGTNLVTGDREIYFTTQSASAPDITGLAVSAVTNAAMVLTYSTDVGPDTSEYRVGTGAYLGTWTTLTGSPQTISSLSANTGYYVQVRFIKNGQTVQSVPMAFRTAAAATGVSVTNITRVLHGDPTVGGNFTNGYHFRFAVTTNSLTETGATFKLADWSNGATTLAILNNTKMIASANGIADYATASGSTTDVTTAYGTAMNVAAFDADPTLGGRQFIIDVFYQIPSGAAGSYSTSYGLQTQ